MKIMDFKQIQNNKKNLEEKRRRFASQADEARRQSKLAIFALQRHESPRAANCLKTAKRLIVAGAALIKKQPLLLQETTWTAALEEYAEASFFASYLKGDLELPDEVQAYPDVILGGLADLAGEIARYAVLRATERDKPALEKAHLTVLKIVDVLAALDLTGSLRSKFDQTKQHLRKIEDLRYDLSK